MGLPRDISASEFKAKCLRLLDDVQKKGVELVVTKHGRAVARIVPIGSKRDSLRGAWKGSVRLHGDIVHVDCNRAMPRTHVAHGRRANRRVRGGARRVT